MDHVGSRQLRQGTALSGDARGPWRGCRSLPRAESGHRLMHGEDRLRAIANQVLAASTTDETEVVISAHENALTRFASSAIHQNVFEAGLEVRVRALLGTRTGVATTNRFDERALADLARNAVESAGFAPENPDLHGLPHPRPIASVQSYASPTASYTPEQRARDVKIICDLSIEHSLDASGAWSTEQM